MCPLIPNLYLLALSQPIASNLNPSHPLIPSYLTLPPVLSHVPHKTRAHKHYCGCHLPGRMQSVLGKASSTCKWEFRPH